MIKPLYCYSVEVLFNFLSNGAILTRIIFLILTTFELILITGCAKKNYVENVDQFTGVMSGTFSRGMLLDK